MGEASGMPGTEREKFMHFYFGDPQGMNMLASPMCILEDFIKVYVEYRVIHKSLRDFRTRLRNNQDRHGRKEHLNR